VSTLDMCNCVLFSKIQSPNKKHTQQFHLQFCASTPQNTDVLALPESSAHVSVSAQTTPQMVAAYFCSSWNFSTL